MDTLSHGLWGAILFGRKNRREFWKSFFWGVMPDMLSLGLFTLGGLLLGLVGVGAMPRFDGPPDIASIPWQVFLAYDITHSFFTFGAVYLIYRLWCRRKNCVPSTAMLAWPLHILVDIPTHTKEFFATPFLWPFSEYRFNGVSWGVWWIFIPNVVVLITLYIWFYVIRPWMRRRKITHLG